MCVRVPHSGPYSEAGEVGEVFPGVYGRNAERVGHVHLDVIPRHELRDRAAADVRRVNRVRLERVTKHHVKMTSFTPRPSEAYCVSTTSRQSKVTSR